MEQRVCDCCGKKKDVSGGKTCERGHFICSVCRNLGFFGRDKNTMSIMPQTPQVDLFTGIFKTETRYTAHSKSG